MSRRRAAALVALLLVPGCGRRSEPVAEAPPPGAARVQRPAPASVDSGFVARGTEPFWSVTIRVDGIRFQEPDRIDGIAGDYAPPVQDGARIVYRTTLRDTVPLPLEIAIEPKPCSDGMSDRTYPYAAVAKIGDRVLQGCADRR